MNTTYYPVTPNTSAPTIKTPAESLVFLPVAQIIPLDTREIPKSEQNQVIRLAASIKKYGILEPLAVKLAGNDVGFPLYELVDGERRFRAATLMGMERLPCTILPANAQKCLQNAYISRLKQEKAHFFALAEAFYALLHDYGMTQDEIARRMRLSQSAVANKLRLLRLYPEERTLIKQAGLSERHARALLRICDAARRREVLASLISKEYTVAEAEALVEAFLTQKEAKKAVFAGEISLLPIKTPPTPPQSTGETVEEQGKETASFHAPEGIQPSKFVLRDLQPLYHSIERALGIFKKTGAAVDYRKQEDEHRALITISIPKKT